MSSIKYPIFLYVFAYFALADFIEKTSDNYGPYKVDWENYTTCRGPKLVNLTTYTSSLVNDSRGYISIINITFMDQTKIEDVKMAVYSTKGGRKVLLWNYIVNKPCQHYVMSKVFETKFGIKNCVANKFVRCGCQYASDTCDTQMLRPTSNKTILFEVTYFSELNFTDIIHNYLGTSFFYGEFVFKVIVLSKKGNILCLMFNTIFKKL